MVALPLIFLPKSIVDARSGFTQSDITLYRFYGVAIFALLVGYAGGYAQAQAGMFPAGIIIMGIVSNAGATLIFLMSGRYKKSPISTLFFATIASALVVTFFARAWAMTPI